MDPQTAQSTGQLAGAAAAGIGIAAGVVGPLALPIGMALGGSAGGLFGGGEKKNHAANRARRQQEQNKKIYDYTWEETKRLHDYQVDGQRIKEKNTENNLAYQDASNMQSYDHNMAIRKYSHQQSNRAYKQSKATAKQQLGFNKQAAEFARMQQSRAYGEQLVGMLFLENQTLMDYNVATAGIATKKRQVGLQERSMMGKAQNETQRSLVQGLEAEGAAQVRGSGRSNAKAMQAAIAKAGANQAAIADELMFGLQGIDSSMLELSDRAAAMKAQLTIDQLMLEATRDNLDAKKVSDRRKIKMDKRQADAVARARIHLKPEMSPAMPVPIALPRPEYQDVYKPKKPPKPKKHTAYQSPPTGGFNQAINSLAAATPTIINAFKGGGTGYQPTQNFGAVSSLSDFSVSSFDNFNTNYGLSDFGLGDGFGDYGQSLDFGSFGSDISFDMSSLGNFDDLSAGGAGYPGLY